ncbi:MAG: hypothetical protein ACERKN_03640 [Velocimicrobium sp.]
MTKNYNNVRMDVYLKNLEKNSDDIDYYNIAKQLYSENIIEQTVLCVSGPMLISYAIWIIKEAKRKEIKRLFFIARDGLIICKIVSYFSKQLDLNIQCNYLYCSRYAMKLPVYYINQELGFDLIFSGGSRVSLNSILKRINFDKQQQKSIISAINYTEEQCNTVLNNVGIKEIRTTLIKCKEFINELNILAKNSYENITKYFLQEGLVEEKIYIVDSGWRGNIQNSISVILKSLNANIEVEGFYFGLEKFHVNQTYNCFYFSPIKHPFRILHFNYNVFENFCSASHGMTVGYKQKNNSVEPILKEIFIKEKFVEIQEKMIFKMIDKITIDSKIIEIDNEKLMKSYEKNMILFINNPTKYEVSYWGNVGYCEDDSESYFVKLAEEIPKFESYHYLLIRRLYERVFTKKRKRMISESMWIKGSFVNYNFLLKKWIYFNIDIFEAIRIFNLLIKNI